MIYNRMSTVCTLQEYRMKYADPKYNRILTVCLFLGYLLVGVSILQGIFISTLALVSALISLVLLLGIQMKRTRGFAAALLVFGVMATVLDVLMNGRVYALIWILLAAVMLVTLRKIDEEYAAYRRSASDGFYRSGGYYRRDGSQW